MIDDRVVQMNFDNEQFEKGVATSLSTLSKLNSTLNDQAGVTSFNLLKTAVGSVDFSNLLNSLDSISNKFSTLEVIAITALTNIVNRAVNAGVSLAKSLSVDQITAGISKYEQNIASTQTIIAATGKSSTEVAKQLEKLLWFSDETSYNFSDMTSNVGKFTSNGVSLENAVTAMQGIASLAAVSGQNATVASRAMYQLSQAMGVGYLTTMDFKSLETYNMATLEFKQTLMDSAVAYGTLTKKAGKYYTTSKDGATAGKEVTAEALRNTLTYRWATKEVMTSTFQEYGEYADQVRDLAESLNITASQAMEMLDDGTITLGEKAFKAAQVAKSFTDAINATKDAVSTQWMETFQYIFGNYDESLELWTNFTEILYDVFVESSNVRNDILSTWYEDGGRDILFKSLSLAWENLTNIFTKLKDVVQKVFPIITGEQLLDKTEKFYNFIKSFNLLTDEEAHGLDTVSENGKVLVETMSKGFSQILTAEKFNYILGNIEKTLTSLKTVFDSIGISVGKIYESVKTLVMAFAQKSINFLTDTSRQEKISKFIEGVGKLIAVVGDIFSRLLKLLSPLINIILFVADSFISLGAAIGDFFTKVNEIYFSNDTLKEIFDTIGNGLTNIINFLNSINLKPLDIFQKILEGIGKVFSWIIGIVSKLWEKIKELFSSLSSNSNVLGGALNFLNISTIIVIFKYLKYLIETGKLFASFKKGLNTSILKPLKTLTDALSTMQKQVKVGKILAIGVAILLLTIAMKKLSTLNIGDLAKGLISIGVLFAELFGAIYIFSQKMKDEKALKSLNKSAIALISLSLALVIMAKAVKILGTLSFASLAKGLTGIIVLLVALGIFINKVNIKNAATKANSIVELAVGLVILSAAVALLGMLQFNKLVQGLAGLSIILGALSIFMNSIADIKPLNMIALSLSITILATSLLLLVASVSLLSLIDQGKLLNGLAGLAIILLSIGVFVTVLNKNIKGLLKAGQFSILSASILVLAAALSIMTLDVAVLGSLKLSSLAKGLVGIIALLASIVVFSKLMSSNKISVGTFAAVSAAMILFGTAISLLVTNVLLLSSMSWENLGKGLIGFLSILAILLTSAIILVKVAGPSLITFSLSLLAVGAAFMLISTSIAIGSAALVVASIAFKNLADVMVSIINNILLLGQNLVSAFVIIGESLGQGFVAFLQVLSESNNTIILAVATLMASLLEAVIINIPLIVGAVVTLITSILDAIIILVPKIMDLVVVIVTSICDTLVSLTPTLIKAGLQIIVDILKGFNDGIPDIVKAAFNLVVTFINTMAETVRTQSRPLMEAVLNLVSAIIEAVLTAIQVIAEKIPVVGDDMSKALEDAKKGVKNALAPETMSDIGTTAMSGFSDGLTKNLGKVNTSGSDVSNSAINGLKDSLGIKSGESSVTTNIGENMDSGLVTGMINKSSKVSSTAKDVAKKAYTAAKKELGIASPSTKFFDLGGYSDQGLANGIISLSTVVEKASSKVGSNALNTMKKSLENVSDIVNTDVNSDPIIKPVLDLSNISSGSKLIDDILNKNRSLDLAESIGSKGISSNIKKDVSEGIESGSKITNKSLSPIFNVTVNGSEGQDVNELANLVSQKINDSVRRLVTTWQ